MFRRAFFATVLAGMLSAYVDARSVDAIPAFARQYDMQCNACHTRPPRLNRFGEQFHMMGFQIPSASRPDGLVGSLKDDGTLKTVIDSLALRVSGGLFRSEEHTSELQSQSNLVCRLLLEKKKKYFFPASLAGSMAAKILNEGWATVRS